MYVCSEGRREKRKRRRRIEAKLPEVQVPSRCTYPATNLCVSRTLKISYNYKMKSFHLQQHGYTLKALC